MRFRAIMSGEESGIRQLSQVASEIVREHYDPILGTEQNDYMIDKFQSVQGITEQLAEGYRYYLVYAGSDARNEASPAGFIAFYPKKDCMYLSKLYLYKEERGKGYGRLMLEFVIGEAEKLGLPAVELNVNINNPTVQVYEKMGFFMARREKNPIGHGFYMDDYVYRLSFVNREIREKLYSLKDDEYGKFQGKLMPDVPDDSIIGVRMPQIRELAKEYAHHPRISGFLSELPHKYYDENILHAAIISMEKDYARAVESVNGFLPYVDNWAVCDILRPKAFSKNHEGLRSEIDRWIRGRDTYTVRFGLGMAMCHFLDEDFAPEYLEAAAGIHSDEYYVNMMIAWYFATALAKQWEAALPYLTDERLPVWVHNKTIQKAIESRRIADDRKTLLRSMKIRGNGNR